MPSLVCDSTFGECMVAAIRLIVMEGVAPLEILIPRSVRVLRADVFSSCSGVYDAQGKMSTVEIDYARAM